jgi:hypothetical protein
MECLDHNNMNRIGHDRRVIDKSLPDYLMYHIQHPVLTLCLSHWLESREIELLDDITSPGCVEVLEAFLFISFHGLLELCLLFILQLILAYQDVVILVDASLGYAEIFLVPPGMPKDVLT